MNVIEREAAPAAGPATEQPDQPAAPEPAPRRKLRPLLSLLPYLARYRWRAMAALVVAASSRRSPRWWCRSRCGA